MQDSSSLLKIHRPERITGPILSTLILGILILSQLQAAAIAAQPPQPLECRIWIDTTKPIKRSNAWLLGNNISWENNAQGLYDPQANKLSQPIMQQADRLAPTVLRFPGGTNADFYHWSQAVGPQAARKPQQTTGHKTEIPLFGTDEFLQLCRRWRAEPLITVNVATGTPEEAAQWVAYTNKQKRNLPPVRYWEIGNEPYLKDNGLAPMPPAEYARRANAFIRAMKAVDPTIQVGIPLRSDKLAGVPATPYPGFNAIALSSINEPFEFVAVHDAYFPVLLGGKGSPEEVYLATMAASQTMADDFQATRQMLSKYKPGSRKWLTVTEYNGLYTLDIARFGAAGLLSQTDRYIESQATALYVAEILRVMAQTNDVLFANYWSLNGNWWFGAIDEQGHARPTFYVLEAFRRLLSGTLLDCRVEAPTLATPQIGFVEAQSKMQSVTALAVKDNAGAVRIAVLNKHPNAAATVHLALDKKLPKQTVNYRELNGDNYFSRDVRWNSRSAPLQDGRLDLAVGAHSLTIIEIAAPQATAAPTTKAVSKQN